MPTPANIRELLLGFGYRKQSTIALANIVGDIWRLNKTNAALLNPKPVTEDDAAELGKGHEFPTTTYPSHWEIGPHTLEKYLSSQIMAWAAGFGLGVCGKTGTSPALTYTCTPSVPVTAGIELPYFSYIEQIRPSEMVTDKMFVGCAVEGFLVTLATGPGRSNSKIAIDFIGSGANTVPSGITLPTKTPEHELPGASLALTIISQDYVTFKDIVSLEWGWKNNLRADSGFYPGSGVQDGYAIRGRMEHGDRTGIIRFTVRFKHDSTEYTTLKNSTTGTAVITQTFDADNTYTATFQQLGFKSVDIGDSDGIVTVAVEGSAQYHSTNGVLTVVAKTDFDNICQAPA